MNIYRENAAAADANAANRCACIVMLNVGLGQLLSLALKASRARSGSSRIVQMGDLTTYSIERAMAQLVDTGHALGPIEHEFLDRRGRIAGTLKPERLKDSVQSSVRAWTEEAGCWFAFGLSIMDGYHSVLLLADRTSHGARTYWLDQNSRDVNDDVTAALDERITDWTRTWWQGGDGP